MKFPTSVSDVELPGLIQKFLQIVGEDAVAKKIAWIGRELEENPYMEEWLHEFHGLEFTLAFVLDELHRTNQVPKGWPTRDQYNLYAFIAGVVRIYEGLSARGQKRLKGMLLDGLKSDKGLSSVAHEVTTATNLVQKGFDVEFYDLENGGVDFIARKDAAELEVECKVFTADIGRQIHKRRLRTLYKTLMPVVQQIHRDAAVGILIRVILPGRLTPSTDQAKQIVESVSSAVLQGSGQFVFDACSVQTLDFPIVLSPFNVPHPSELSRKAVVEFVGSRIGVSNLNPSLAMIFTPGKQAVILLVESAIPDRVLKGMERQLRDAAKGQFTRTRPGILAAHIHALTGVQLVSLDRLSETDPQNPTGLRVMTSQFLDSESRKHIHTVSYQARGELAQELGDGAITEQGVSYFIVNPHNPECQNDAYKIFANRKN